MLPSGKWSEWLLQGDFQYAADDPHAAGEADVGVKMTFTRWYPLARLGDFRSLPGGTLSTSITMAVLAVVAVAQFLIELFHGPSLPSYFGRQRTRRPEPSA